MVPSDANKPSTSQPKAKVKAIEKIEERPYYIIVYRQLETDPWQHKGLGAEFFRDKEFAMTGIPAESTEAYIVEITLPI